MKTIAPTLTLLRLGVIAGLTLLLACADSPTETVSVDGVVQLAKPGGGGPTVDAAQPNAAPPDITLDVRVFGSGFDNGSQARWLLSGVAANKIRTNSTNFVSKSELIANITIDFDALELLYDIEVVTRRGKKGVGAELFSVDKNAKPVQDNPEGPNVGVTFDGAIVAGKQVATLSSDGQRINVYRSGVWLARFDLGPLSGCQLHSGDTTGLSTNYLTQTLGDAEQAKMAFQSHRKQESGGVSSQFFRRRRTNYPRKGG